MTAQHDPAGQHDPAAGHRPVGMVGTGNMGGRMTRRMVEAGHAVLAVDADPARIPACGATQANSLAELAERCDVIMLSLPDSPVIEAVIRNPGGLLEHARDGQVIVDLSTANPASTRALHDELAGRGVRYLDAGISGGAAGAEKGTLTLMVGGDGFEQSPKKIALAEPAVTVLREGRMVGHVPVEAKPAEPAVGQIEVNLVAQPPLGTNAVAVAHQQHADHQLGIDRGSAHLAVVRLKVSPNVRQIDEPIDLAQHVTAWDVPLQAEAIEQRFLHHPPFAHHRPISRRPGEVNQDAATLSSGVFQQYRPIAVGQTGLFDDPN